MRTVDTELTQQRNAADGDAVEAPTRGARQGLVAARAGAIAYILWGALHALVGLGGLLPIAGGDVAAALAVLADRIPGAAAVNLHPGLAGLLANHAFNLLWGGTFAAIVGTLFNWHNSRPGYWANLAVVSGFDLGFILFVVAPGHISIESALPGPLLWVAAAVLTTIGRLHAGVLQRRRQHSIA